RVIRIGVYMKEELELLKKKCGIENYNKLINIKNDYLVKFIAEYVKLLNPDSVFVCDDSQKDFNYIREKAVKDGEEIELDVSGHTVHYDGPRDQARDKKATKFLVPEGMEFGKGLNVINKKEGVDETKDIMSDIMVGTELIIVFFTLGPGKSPFTIPAVQLTDSSYVAHSEIILYRPGYEEFKRPGDCKDFFRFVHSEGELENAISRNVPKRRIYIDTEENIVYSMNTQYGGNTIGLKKPAMRLAINKASKEGWLTEHMFVSGVHGPAGRVTYFAGAFPSMCGKTSTAMVKGETIIGDDIAYIRNIGGKARAVNVEVGVFGIIKDINSVDDPIIWNVLHNENETIFSNVLMSEDGKVYWIGKPGKMPEKGINYTGKWYPGKVDDKGNEIGPSHKNARFTTNLKNLENIDPEYNNPDGVLLGGVIYGGRDSDTLVPLQQAYEWGHGIVTMGASIESETTAATLGETGVREFNPMSNLDFLSIPIGRYVDINMKFGQSMEKAPLIFGVNYFIKGKDGKYLNSKMDKMVWLKWMELRVNGEVGAVDIGTGLIPEYKDLKVLFSDVLDRNYSREDYNKQFTLRIPENLSKIDRVIKIYREIDSDVPGLLFKILEEQKKKLNSLKSKKGEYISPESFE
ncbi:MAG: phosphoenolpyruvate carboxykinase (GTP), partial [Actinomycetota bacterium]|nr:phosphoenolpyruvate carboxykinase (GTP) [Actinomycetota bacterium]